MRVLARKVSSPMRELTAQELSAVSGGAGDFTQWKVMSPAPNGGTMVDSSGLDIPKHENLEFER